MNSRKQTHNKYQGKGKLDNARPDFHDAIAQIRQPEVYHDARIVYDCYKCDGYEFNCPKRYERKDEPVSSCVRLSGLEAKL